MKPALLMATAFAVLAGCAAADGARESRRLESLAAPTPAGVATRIAASDNGGAVTVRAGTKIAVELVGVPTAGYRWKVSAQPAFLTPAGEYGGPTSTAQLEPGFAGGDHWEGFLFDVTGSGAGDLRFEQGRAWDDSDEPPANDFAVRLIAEE